MRMWKKIIEKQGIKKLIYNQKTKWNENRFYIQTKISTKIKIKDKKKFTNKFMGGGAIFRGDNFRFSNGERLFLEPSILLF